MSLLKLVNNYRNNLVACNYVIHDEKRLFSSSRLQIELYSKTPLISIVYFHFACAMLSARRPVVICAMLSSFSVLLHSAASRWRSATHEPNGAPSAVA